MITRYFVPKEALRCMKGFSSQSTPVQKNQGFSNHLESCFYRDGALLRLQTSVSQHDVSTFTNHLVLPRTAL